MATERSIRQLYTPALAEGEGIGTAYEYYAKRLVLLPWLRHIGTPRRILIAGLPQTYGSSLDFLLLAAEQACPVTVVDDRPEALAALSAAIEKLAATGQFPSLQPQLVLANEFPAMAALKGPFDLALSSEVLQRLAPLQRRTYVDRLRQIATGIALFAPNADNAAHVGRSGLDGLVLRELRTLCGFGRWQITAGYIDMPPFPPGITRTATQREEAATGILEATAMRGLALYARAEHFFPAAARRRWSHIVYALCSVGQR
jgi:hypothetical protein